MAIVSKLLETKLYPSEMIEQAQGALLDCLEPLGKFPVLKDRPLVSEHLTNLNILHSECSHYLAKAKGCTVENCMEDLKTSD